MGHKVDYEIIRRVYAETGSTAQTARQLGLSDSTVYVVTKMLAKNICRACGKPRHPSKRYCKDCLQKAAQKAAVIRKEHGRLGLCYDCDKPTQPGYRRCQTHRIRDNDHSPARKLKRGQPVGDVTNAAQKRAYLLEKYGQPGVDVWERDKGACALCKASYSVKSIHVHHINRDETDHRVENMTCLCFSCHKLIHLLVEHPSFAAIKSFLLAHYPTLPW